MRGSSLVSLIYAPSFPTVSLTRALNDVDPFAEIYRGKSTTPGMRDPLGLLKEGQVYFRSSQPLKDRDSELLYHTITGEVVVRPMPSYRQSSCSKDIMPAWSVSHAPAF